MGASAGEIEQQIEETRGRLDTNLDELEGRAASKAVRYGRIAAVAAGVAAAGVAAFVIWRRTRRRTLRDRIEALSVGLREMSERLREQLPTVTVRVDPEEPQREPGTVEAIVREVAPALIGTAATAGLRRLGTAGQTEDSGRTPPQAD